MTTLDDLIARLEKAEGPDRELSDDILLACGWIGPPQSARMAGILVPHWKRPHGGGDVPSEMRPHPTASIDAAATTALKGWRWSVGNGPNGYEAHCFRTLPPGERDGSYGRGDSFASLDAPTPAIALMTVLLKARKTEAAA